MGVFYQEEPPNTSKKCKFLTNTLKGKFSSCRFCRQVSTSSPEEEKPMSDFDDEQQVIISTIRSRAREKSRQRPFVLTDSFSGVFSSITGELFLAPKIVGEKHYNDNEAVEEKDIGMEEFVSVGSCFSCRSTGFISVKTNFSRSSSLSSAVEFQDFSRLQQFCQCEGWPFGLCRKAVLVPPLPKSPSESWSWRKGTRIDKMH